MSCLSSVLENLKDLNILADSFLVLPTVTCVTNMYVNTPLQKTSERKYGLSLSDQDPCENFVDASVAILQHASKILPAHFGDAMADDAL
jgi:hypothetical protein